MVLDKFVDVEFGGKKHRLCYPIRQVFEAERQLTDGNIMVMLTKAGEGVPPTLYDMFTIVKFALLGGDPKLTEEEAEEMYLEAVAEVPVLELFRLSVEALKKSGVLGSPKKAEAAEA